MSERLASSDTLAGEVRLALPELDSPPADPLPLLAEWLAGARQHGVREPLALTLATVDRSYAVSTRVVLVKEVDEHGLVFTTHHGSRKGRDLAAVPRAAGSLYWRETLQQINVAGPVERLDDAASDALFAERPAAARATAIASCQGVPLEAPEELREQAHALLAADRPLTRPTDWGGYRLRPDHVEFWHGSVDRLHRRLAYERAAEGWRSDLLQP